ncbi:DUF4893 domain-containing protein [Sphingomonas profundi]|uniref:DUF4893 domain-containing protein n=1 Tax=Alterirhizorhabdus profundi TaxID=2681549 RepID=UPI001E5502CB|nr:DUF4893 domain-containing protein [Sphingomonas profundi]
MAVTRRVAIAAMMLLCGCAGRSGQGTAAPPSPSWRTIATAADRDRLRTWRDAWTRALAKVTSPADRAAVAAEGRLLQPDAAEMEPVPPPGDYRCRTIKLGASGTGGMDYIAYPAFTCRIAREADVLSLTKLDGSQRPVGLLFPDDGGRMIFLGTMMLGDETRALDYGRDPVRDVAGLLERLGPRRWRLVMPFPRWESTVDVMELVPKGG